MDYNIVRRFRKKSNFLHSYYDMYKITIYRATTEDIFPEFIICVSPITHHRPPINNDKYWMSGFQWKEVHNLPDAVRVQALWPKMK